MNLCRTWNKRIIRGEMKIGCWGFVQVDFGNRNIGDLKGRIRKNITAKANSTITNVLYGIHHRGKWESAHSAREDVGGLGITMSLDDTVAKMRQQSRRVYKGGDNTKRAFDWSHNGRCLRKAHVSSYN